MTLSRRDFLALAGIGGAAAALAGCGGQLEPADVTVAGFGEGASGTLNLWCRSDTLTGNEAMVEAFHAAQERIRVELTPIPNSQYVTKLATAIRGRRPPDLVDIDDIYSALFIYRDAFTDLTPLIEELPYRDRLSPGHLGLATKDDRFYAVPFLADNSVLFCNLDLFERAGVDVDEATGSFAGYLEAARAISALEEDVYGWSYPGNASGALGFTVQPHIWATDTDLIAGQIGGQTGNVAGNESVRRTLELLRTFWEEDLVPPVAYADDASRWNADYLSGRIGMKPASYGVIVPDADPALLERTEVRLLAGPDGGVSFFDGGDNFAIPNGAANPSAAWEYVRFCLEIEQQSNLPAGGYTPVRADAATDAFREQFPLAVAPLEQLDAGYAPLSLSYNRIYNQPDGPWLEMFRRAVFAGEIEAAMDEAQDRYDLILRQGDA
ncbi:MAG TPA: sugar ABC transporter substrate-binding protein [Micromonosporaceae bacterium]|nr:sugar ABC transporter substrate-binding protein [Micromonosporaceae bacterium]